MSNIFRKQGINTGGGGSIDTSALANKTDLTAIILTGTTNTSGNVISAGTWFYLNGTPCIAKVDIASGATFTEGTNYEEKTIGSALSELNSNSNGTTNLSGVTWKRIGNIVIITADYSGYAGVTAITGMPIPKSTGASMCVNGNNWESVGGYIQTNSSIGTAYLKLFSGVSAIYGQHIYVV